MGAGWLAWVAVVPAAAAAVAWPAERAGRLAVPVAYAVYLELLLVPALPFGLAEGQWNHAPVPLLIGGSPVIWVALLAVPLFAALLYALRFGQAPQTVSGLAIQHRCWIARPDTVLLLLAVAVPALSWTALDFARTSLDPGGAFGPLFLSQHDGAAARLAALGGPWLLTLAIVAVGYGLALALVRGRGSVAVAALALVLAAAVAADRAGLPDGEGGLTVAAIQPGYDTAEEGRPELRFFEPGSYGRAAVDTIADLAPLTHAAAARGADVVVWPEAAIWVHPARSPLAGPPLRRLARESGAAIVVPYFLQPLRRSAAIVFRPDGATSGSAPKQRPMWFLGERGWGDSGPPAGRPLDTGARVRAGTLLGVDNQAPGLAARLAGRDAGLLASATHDWEQLAAHQRAAAQLHAAAVGVPLVRADWRYGSAIYGAGGEQLADAGEGKRRTVVVAAVDGAASATPYARIGDVVAWVSLAGALLAWLAAAVPQREAGRRLPRPRRRSRVASPGREAERRVLRVRRYSSMVIPGGMSGGST